MKVKGSLVFYIGNGAVKGGIVAYEKNEPPRIISSRSRDLAYFVDRDREHLEKRIAQEFTELVKDIKTKDVLLPGAKNVRIDDALLILASPWYVSETSIIKMKEQRPFIVTDKLIEASKDNIIKAYRDANQVDVKVLEQRILQISLNGYQTDNPIRKKATSLDMVVFTSFARNSSVEEFKRILDQSFHLPEISVHSQSLASFSIVNLIWKDVGQYILADVTAELTELVVIRNGALAEAASFPKGKKHIIMAISENMGVTEEVAVSFLVNMREGTLDSKLADKINNAVADAKKEWLVDFSKALSQMSSGTSLPQRFFLFAPKDVASFFSDFIVSESYQQFSFAEGSFQVRVVDTADLKNLCVNDRGVTPDLPVVVAALFNVIK